METGGAAWLVLVYQGLDVYLVQHFIYYPNRMIGSYKLT